MRTTRWFIAGLVCSASFSAAASAQQARYFDDSWFWGVKSGVATFSPTLGGNETAATYGGEWLITRQKGGLYVSVDQANVSTVSAVVDANTSDGLRPVTVNKLRRVGFAALAFPVRFGRVRPYAGLGLSLNMVGSASPQLSAKENSVDDAVSQRIDDHRSQAGVLGMAGLQVQFERLAIFGQASVVGASSSFLLGNSTLGFFEGGVRYNIGSSRSR
ncbi:MAG: hypothetical protein ABI875_06285 [Gemmatimonadales bacterium]